MFNAMKDYYTLEGVFENNLMNLYISSFKSIMTTFQGSFFYDILNELNVCKRLPIQRTKTFFRCVLHLLALSFDNKFEDQSLKFHLRMSK